MGFEWKDQMEYIDLLILFYILGEDRKTARSLSSLAPLHHIVGKLDVIFSIPNHLGANDSPIHLPSMRKQANGLRGMKNRCTRLR